MAVGIVKERLRLPEDRGIGMDRITLTNQGARRSGPPEQGILPERRPMGAGHAEGPPAHRRK